MGPVANILCANLAAKDARRVDQSAKIMVRLSKPLHLRLKEIAARNRISLNELCLAALDVAALELEPKAG